MDASMNSIVFKELVGVFASQMNKCVMDASYKILLEFSENISKHYNIPMEDLHKNILNTMKTITVPQGAPITETESPIMNQEVTMNSTLMDAQKSPPIDTKEKKPKKIPKEKIPSKEELPDEIRCCALVSNKRCNKPRKGGKYCKSHANNDSN